MFLDRDGVLNEPIVRQGRTYPPTSIVALKIIPGVPAACKRLRSLGFLLAMVTNQPDIARGIASVDDVTQINRHLQLALNLDSVWVCPHDDEDGCACRKPSPGLILDAALHHSVDLPSSFMVGDRWRDIAAGNTAGCHTVLLLEPRNLELNNEKADWVTGDLIGAARWIAALETRGGPAPIQPQGGTT